MKLPNQVMPVIRGTTNFKMVQGIYPSGDCKKGYWCCNSSNGPKCRPCMVVDPFSGACWEYAETVCARYGESVSHSC